MNSSICQKRKHTADRIWKLFINLSALLCIALLVGILGYVFVKGIPQLSWSFITTEQSSKKFGILGNIINTLYIISLTLLIATPLGIGSAIYLNEYARPGKLLRAIEFTTEILSGIPSIIFGLFGMMVFGRLFRLSYSVLTGSFTLTLMILPLITRNTQEALKTVPDSYRAGALGIGATKWYMIRTVLLPSAMPGILTGVILAIGRIVGESAALLFTAGSGFLLPKNLFSKFLESSGTLTVQLYLCMTKGQFKQAFGIAVVLLGIVLGINMLARYVTRRFDVTKLD